MRTRCCLARGAGQSLGPDGNFVTWPQSLPLGAPRRGAAMVQVELDAQHHAVGPGHRGFPLKHPAGQPGFLSLTGKLRLGGAGWGELYHV